MSLTLLLDLDGTLLTNPLDEFVPAYMQALAAHLAPYVDPTQALSALLAGTRQMIRNQQPDCTLADVFNSVFYPALNVLPEDLKEAIDRFYLEIFPTLQKYSKPNPEAVKMVDEAFRRGSRVVIATNPLFPLTAIEQRLGWAGLPREDYPFALVPSFETFHFTKPNPAYLAELLASLGWPDEPVAMVGDDARNDIQTAREMGIPNFWITSTNGSEDIQTGEPRGYGSVEDFFHWLDSIPEHRLKPDYTQPQALLAILRSTPAALQRLCQSLAFDQWYTRVQPNEWCQTEILCHLRDVEVEVNLPRLEKVIKENNPFLAGKDTDPWAVERDYLHQDGARALHGFMAARMKLLNLLHSLPAEGWQRPARHAIFGPTHLGELVSIIAGHDRLHIQQAYGVIQAQTETHDKQPHW